MNIKSCEKKDKSEFEIIVEVSSQEFETAIGKAFIKNRKSISVPGFRKGKAPRKIVERMYGETVFHADALDILLPEVLVFSESETDLNTVGYPQITDVDINDDNGVNVTIAAAIYPEVTLGEYKGLSAVKPDVEIPETTIDAEVAAVRFRNARIEKADRPAQDGDIAVIDYDGYLNGEQFEGGKGENYELELGSNTFIPGFEDQVVGMVMGEEREINLTFPEQYTEPLAGKPVVFKVKLNELKEKLLPELDDEFAKDVSEFDTLDEYKADIRDRLKKAKQSEIDAVFENALLEKVIESMEADVPATMIEEHMDHAMNNFAQQIQSYGMDPASYLQMMNMTPEAFRESMRVTSEKQVKINLALEKIAALEAFEATPDDIEKEYAEAAERFGMEIEKIKERVDEKQVVKEILSRAAARLITDTAIAEAPPPAEENEKVAKAAVKKAKAADESDATAKKAKVTKKSESAEKAEKPAAESKKASADKTTAKKPATKKPATEITADPAAEKPATKKAAPKKAATEKPTTKNATAKKAAPKDKGD